MLRPAPTRSPPIRNNRSNIVGSNRRIDGDYNNIVGSNCTIVGCNNNITGSNNEINGNGNKILGSNSTVFGHGNDVTGSNQIVRGDRNKVIGSNCKTWGSNNTIEGSNNQLNGRNVPNSTRGTAIINNSSSIETLVLLGPAISSSTMEYSYPQTTTITGIGEKKPIAAIRRKRKIRPRMCFRNPSVKKLSIFHLSPMKTSQQLIPKKPALCV